MFKIIGMVVVLVIAAILILAALKPDVFRIQRSVLIKGTPETIFPYLNDLHRFTEWSPYEHKDPNMKREFSSDSSGVGAVYRYEGNANVGAGKLTITDVQEPGKVVISLEFVKPFACQNVVEFTLVNKGDATEVSWTMYGPVPYPAKIMHVIFNVDKMVGKDFEDGLAALKKIIEK